jgi:stage II sporulation protein D
MRPRTLLALLLLLAYPAGASADDSRLTIRGAGFGHGVGMSQYGAMGFAQQGASYRDILAHYYSGTGLGDVSGQNRVVRVLVQSAGRRIAFSGATRAAGLRRLRPERTYGARARRGAVELLSPTGRRLGTIAAPLRVTGPGPVALRDKGAYRGALEIRPAGRGVDVINAVGLDDYVQGVVPVESPSSWPIEALKAQAVAARTYAITTSKGGAGFDQYADTRSQVYGGASVERPSTNEAVAQTRGQVVTYEGRPVVTYFFSTSGGRTEDVENTSLGSQPLPWLKSVEDPYDTVSPRHRWGPLRLTFKQAGKRLKGLVSGAFRGIEVLQRGASPRVMVAEVVGTRGRTRVTGAQLRARLGLLDTWAYFTSVTTREDETPPPEPEPDPDPPAGPAGTSGGAQAGASRTRLALRSLTGRIVGGGRREAVVEVRTAAGWRRAGSVRIRRDGAYRFGLCAKGAYRVRVGSATGPVVRVRSAGVQTGK